AHDRLREAGYQISAELLLRNQVQRGPQGRQVILRDRRRSPQRALWDVETFEGTFGLCNGCRRVDGDQYRDLFMVELKKSANEREVFFGERDRDEQGTDLF